MEKTQPKLQQWLAQHNNNTLIVATGFIARNTLGQPTTLKRCVLLSLMSSL